MADEFTIQEFEDVFLPVPDKITYSENQANDIAVSTAMLQSLESDPIAVYSQVKSDFMKDSNSPFFDSVKNKLEKEDLESEDQAILNIVSNDSIDQTSKIALIDEYQRSRSIKKPFDLEEHFLNHSASLEVAELPIEQEVKEDQLSYLDELISARYDSQSLVLEYLENNGGTLEHLGDLALSLIPGQMNASYISVLKSVRPELFSAGNAILAGEALNVLRQEKNKLSGQELIDYTQDVIKAIEESGGFTGGNEFLKLILTAEIFQEELDQGEPTNVFRYLEDAGSILDFIFIGQLIKSAVAANRAISIPQRLSRLGRLTQVNRSQASTTAAQGINNPSLANALNTNLVSIIQDFVFPSFRVNRGSVVPADTLDKLVQLESKGLDVFDDTRAFSINYSDLEKAQMVTRAQREIDASVGARYYQPMSRFNHDDEGFTINAVFGMTDTKGFKTGNDALNRAKTLFTDDVPLKIYKIDKRGQLEDVTSQSKLQLGRFGEYFFEADLRYNFELGRAEIGALKFSPDDITGKTTKKLWTSGPQGAFSRTLSRRPERGLDFGRGVTARTANIIKDNFNKLSEDSKLKVISAVDEGELLRTNFDVIALQARGLNSDEIKGYYGIRGMNDTMYFINDRRMVSTLNELGMKQIEAKGGYKAPARPYDDVGIAKSELTKSNNEIFDPVSSQIIKMTNDEIDKLYANGGRIALLFREEKVGSVATNYIKIDPNDKVFAKFLPSKFLLPYYEGYITRLYDDPFVVTRVERVTKGGQQVERRVGVAFVSSEKEAIDASNNLTSTTKIKHDYKIERSLLPNERVQLEWDIMRGSTTTPIMGKRGQHVKGANGGILANTLDPIEEMQKALDITGFKAGMEDFLKGYKLRFVNSFGNQAKDTRGNPLDVLPEINGQSVLPLRVSDIYSRSKGLTDEAKKARLAFSYLQTVQNTPSRTAEWWKQLITDWGRKVQGIGLERTGNFLIKHFSGKSPDDIAQGFASNMLIMASPLRQVVLQASQATFAAALEPRYVITGNWLKDYTAFLPAWIAFDNPAMFNKLRPIAAQVMGVSEKELTDLVKGFKSSGIPNAITANEFIRRGLIEMSNSISQNTGQRVTRKTLNALKFPFQVQRLVGFDTGEFLNMSSTFLVAWKRWQRNNPGKSWQSKSALAEISGDTRQISLSMTRPGSFPYQKGWLGVMFQFMAISHKAVAAMLPKMLGGSNVFTGYEKARIASAQFLLWGTAMIPFLKEGVDKANDELDLQLTEEQKQAYVGNLVERTLNSIMENYTDERGRLEIATSFAPSGGIRNSLLTLARNYTLSPEQIIEGGLSPPVVAAGHRVWSALSLTHDVFKLKDMSEPENWGLALSAFASWHAQYNNYLKMSAGLRFHEFHDRSGNPTVEATFSEALSKGLFGFTSKNEAEFYELKAKMIATKGRPGGTSHLEEIAQTYLDRITAITVYHSNLAKQNGSYDLQRNLLKEAIEVENWIWATLDPLDKSIVFKMVQQRIDDQAKRNDDKLLQGLVDLTLSGYAGSDIEGLVNAFQNRKLFNNPEHVERLKKLDEFIATSKRIEENIGNIRE